MVMNPEPDEGGEDSEGCTGTREQRDGREEEEEETERDEEEEREEQTEGPESRTESARELSGEVEKWRDGREGIGDGGSLADDEDEDEEEGEDQITRMKAAQAFTPLVTILRPVGNQLDLNESSVCCEEPQEKVPESVEESQPPGCHQHLLQHQDWTPAKETPEHRCGGCDERVTLAICLSAAAVTFPLLVWAGFELLPFDAPPLSSAPFRLVYTLRCAFFATLPIVLGVLVQGASWFKFAALKPLFEGRRGAREVIVHGNYVRDSVHLYLLYFIQLAVMATYICQDMLKLVPLLTIIFVFGRLIYWMCVVFGSSVRSLGFGLSFLPTLVLLAANLYFVCSSSGPDAVFDVTPPTTAPPRKQSWWG